MTHIVRNTTRVLRGLFLFRLFTMLFGGIILAARSPIIGPAQTTNSHPLWGLTMLPGLLAMVYVLIPGLQKRLRRWYLPIALALTILGFSVESVVEYLFPGITVRIALPSGRELNIAWAPMEMILVLLLPCMLGGAAYGMRGALRTAHFATLLHLLTGIVVWHWAKSPHGFLALLPLRMAVLYVFPLITGYLSDTWRKEHEALEAANRHLRGYATTVERLATSRERVRLARAMHDTLAHSLSAIIVQLEAIDALQASDPAAVSARLAQVRQQAQTGLKETRQAIQDLRAAPVEELGLVEALEQLTQRFGQRSGIQTDYQIQGDPSPFLPAQANALYRIAEEAFDNVERHAGASQIVVRLSYTDGVTLTIQDNGRGFDPAQIDADKYGLVGIRERAELVGGQVMVDSAPNRGTTLAVHVAELQG